MDLYTRWKNNHTKELANIINIICTRRLGEGKSYILLRDLKSELRDRGIENLDDIEEVIDDVGCKILNFSNQHFVVFNKSLTVEELERDIESNESSIFVNAIKKLLEHLSNVFGN